MFGGAGSWSYSTLAGLSRAVDSRSWNDLVIQPPGPETGLHANLSWASASIDTPMGLVAAAWAVPTAIVGSACGVASENTVMSLECKVRRGYGRVCQRACAYVYLHVVFW